MMRAALGLSVAGVLGLAGCLSLGDGTPPTRYYVLEAMDAAAEDASRASITTAGSLSVGVGPVVIPSAIDRPQIVTRTGSREVLLADFDRWAEPLSPAVARVLCANLSALLGSDGVYTVDFPVSASPSWRVPVEIVRFEGAIDEDAVLEAVWAVERVNGPLEFPSHPRVKRSSYRVAVEGAGYDALVVALSRCLEALSREIAEELSRASSGASH